MAIHQERSILKDPKKSDWLQSLMDSWQGRLLRYTRRFVKGEVARELVQEGFARLWAEPREKTEGHEKEWLFHVCRNLAIDYLRKEKRVQLTNTDGVLAPATEDLLIARETQGKLTAVLRTLPALQQEVLRLKFQESMTYKEIASVTGLSVSYVGVLVYQGLNTLRKKVAPEKGKP